MYIFFFPRFLKTISIKSFECKDHKIPCVECKYAFTESPTNVEYVIPYVMSKYLTDSYIYCSVFFELTLNITKT